jgi:methylmalonyl-CoA/ethylmalonyl-CoA epimerase
MGSISLPNSPLRSVAHVSYAVKDIEKTATAWSRLYGIGSSWAFSEVGHTDENGKPWKLKIALADTATIQVELCQVVEGYRFQKDLLDKWGEGIQHVAFYVDDVDAQYKRLKAAGAKSFDYDPGVLTFFDAAGTGGTIFELMKNKPPTSAASSPVKSQFKVKSVDHISYAVKDFFKVIDSWSRLYGIGPWKYDENGGMDAKGRPWKIRMAFAYVAGVEFELVQCTEGRIFQSRFLDTWGEGVHHIGFKVEDVDKEVAGLAGQGVKGFVYDPGKFAYLDAGGVGGAIFELMQRK